MREAEYLTGFVRFLPDEAYTQATRLKLVQVLSAGYDRVNIAGAREGARADLLEWWRQLRGGGRAYLMLILAVYKKLTTFHQNVAGWPLASGHSAHGRHLRTGGENGWSGRAGQYWPAGGPTPAGV